MSSLPPMLLVELYILDPAPRRVHHPLGGGVQLPRLRQPRELLELRHEGAEAVGRHEARRAALGHVAELLEVSLHTTHKRDTLHWSYVHRKCKLTIASPSDSTEVGAATVIVVTTATIINDFIF